MAHPFRDGNVVELVHFSEKYAEAVADWYYDMDYRFFFREFDEAMEIEEIKTLGQDMATAGNFLLVILNKETQEPIGLMTYTLEKRSARIYKFGIMLDNNVQNKSWAIDAINVLGDLCFRVKKCHKLVVEFRDCDKHIHRITAQGGFKHEATLPEEIQLDDKYYDEVRYSIYEDTYWDLYKDFLPQKES